MKTIINKTVIKLHSLVSVLILMIAFNFTSCSKSEELEIRHNFPFEVKVLPVPKEISNGQTVEIRFSIESIGNYNDSKYYIRYFQFDGKGTLQYHDSAPYVPNDLYQLTEKQFRLYYTSASSVTQSFEVWISDDFGNEKNLKFEFNNVDRSKPYINCNKAI